MMRRLHSLLALAMALVVAACATDAPTDVGGSLLSSGDLVTFEVNLPASSFLVYDTSFSGYGTAPQLQYAYVAQQFEGALDVHELVRFSVPPTVFSVRNASGTLVNDSFPVYYTGQLVMKFDTTILQGTKPVKLHLYHTAESWDNSATWTNRVDTAGVHLPWATPGGTTGASIDTATWSSGDSVIFHVDSASLARWRDTTNATRGALIVAETNGARMRVLSTAVHTSARSSIRSDTTLTADLFTTVRTILINPTLASPASSIRIGSVPAWRTILRLRPDLQGTSFTCPSGTGTGATCAISLDSAHISVAQLLLKPVRPPAGFSPEDTLVLQLNTLAVSNLVPLERSPLGSALTVSHALPPSLFLEPADSIVKLDLTRFIRHLVNPAADSTQRLAPYLALLVTPEPSMLGLATFDSNVTLRLVLTAAIERRP